MGNCNFRTEQEKDSHTCKSTFDHWLCSAIWSSQSTKRKALHKRSWLTHCVRNRSLFCHHLAMLLKTSESIQSVQRPCWKSLCQILREQINWSEIGIDVDFEEIYALDASILSWTGQTCRSVGEKVNFAQNEVIWLALRPDALKEEHWECIVSSNWPGYWAD